MDKGQRHVWLKPGLLVAWRRWGREVCTCTINRREIPKKRAGGQFFLLQGRYSKEQRERIDPNNG